MRGKVACADQTIQPDGITPRGRKSPFRPTAARTLRDDRRGKSPRMGGLVGLDGGLKVSGRLVTNHPAQALKGSPRMGGDHPRIGKLGSVCRCPWDHPRMGGEKWFIALLFGPCDGSPPRGREKPSLFCGGSSDSGSPPHRRGKVRLRENLERVKFTPAWAGKKLADLRQQALFHQGITPHGRGKARRVQLR